MSSFQFKFNTSRAEDILEGNDPVVHAGAVAIRGMALPLTSDKDSNKMAFLSVRGEKLIESQLHQQKMIEEHSDLTSAFDDNNNNNQQEEKSHQGVMTNRFVAEALSRGFAIRRQRSTNDGDKIEDIIIDQKAKEEVLATKEDQNKKTKKSSNNNKKNDKKKKDEEEKIELPKRQEEKKEIIQSVAKVPSNLQYHLLLTPQELQRLQTSMTNYHQTTTRSDSKSLFEKFSERLAIQRAVFVNDMIETERRKQQNSTSSEKEEMNEAEGDKKEKEV